MVHSTLRAAFSAALLCTTSVPSVGHVNCHKSIVYILPKNTFIIPDSSSHKMLIWHPFHSRIDLDFKELKAETAKQVKLLPCYSS